MRLSSILTAVLSSCSLSLGTLMTRQDMAKPVDLPNDPRFEHRFANVNGTKYHYLFAEPKDGKVKATVVLVHGWPDISAGWRYQIPALLELGCRVICPDMMGYGGTDAPQVPPNDLRLYSMKRAADDIQQLVKQLGYDKIVLGGHDWGGMVIWRTFGWHPELISHIFSVATPYTAPSPKYVSTEDLVKGPLPQFAYQLHLASGEVEQKIKSRGDIRQFLRGMYGGKGPNGELVFAGTKGVMFENIPKVGPSRIISEKELDYYADEYVRHGLHGPLNWYRTRRVNYEDELKLDPNAKIKIPALMISASKDVVLTPAMAAGMKKYFDNLTQREVNAGHWALWEAAGEVNDVLRQWFRDQVFKPSSNL